MSLTQQMMEELKAAMKSGSSFSLNGDEKSNDNTTGEKVCRVL
jgi:hypothetical protein